MLQKIIISEVQEWCRTNLLKSGLGFGIATYPDNVFHLVDRQFRNTVTSIHISDTSVKVCVHRNVSFSEAMEFELSDPQCFEQLYQYLRDIINDYQQRDL